MSKSGCQTYLFMMLWDPIGAGGVNQVVCNLYRSFRLRGNIRLAVLVHDWQILGKAVMRRVAGRPTIRMRLGAPQFGEARYRSWLSFVVRLPFVLVQVATLARRLRVAVLNAHYPDLCVLPWIIARRIGLYRGRVVLSLHGSEIRTAATLSGLERRLWSWMISHSDLVIACSEGLRSETVSAFPEAKDRVLTIYNGVDAPLVRSSVQSVSPPDWACSGRWLVSIGSYDFKKGQDVLLRSFAALLPEFPDLQLAIAGRSGPTGVFEELQRLATELNIAPHLRLLRDLDHATALSIVRRAEIFVLPSRSESFSLALLEAGALERPVIATRICGVDELIRDGIDGSMVEAGDPDALAQAIRRLLCDQALARSMAVNLHRRVVERHTWAQATQSYVDLTGIVR